MKYTVPYTVRYSDLDPGAAMNPVSLVTFSQDLTSVHYATAGLDIPTLRTRGLTWVITKQRFLISSPPRWMDSFSGNTWAKPPRGPFCFRDFSYIGDNGETHLAGTSCWMVLDLSTGKPIKPDESVFGNLEFDEDDAPCGDFVRFTYPVFAAGSTFVPALKVTLVPTILDIDVNSHVNNISYFRWSLAATPMSVCASRRVAEIDTYFTSQALLADTLTVDTALSGDPAGSGPVTCIYRITRKTVDPKAEGEVAGESGEEEIYRARVLWK